MGWQNIYAAVLTAGNTTVINQQGLFVYNGKPALGNLIASLAPTGGTDPYGNVYTSYFKIYGSSGSAINMGVSGPNAAIIFNPGNVTHLTLAGQAFAGSNNPGAANEQEALIFTSGKAGGDDAAIQLFSESADATVAATIVAEFGGTVIATLTKTLMSLAVPIQSTAGTRTLPTELTTDSWQVGTLINGWTGSGAGVNGFRYRLGIENVIEYEGDIINTTVTGNSIFFNQPAAPYANGLARNEMCNWNNPGGTNPPWLFYNGANWSIIGITVANKEIFFQGWIPLN